jgi:hypothetical protein
MDAKWLADTTMIESSDLPLTRMPLNNGGATCLPWALALSFPTPL